MLKPLKKNTVVDAIIKMLLELINKKFLKPGDKLPSERLIAEQLNVSRTSVREALHALAFSNVITIKPGSGTYLSYDRDAIWNVQRKYNPTNVKKSLEYLEVCEYRILFDPKIASLASKNARHDDKNILIDSYNQMLSFLDSKEFNKYHVEDLNFHIAIAKATHNEIIYDSYCTAINYLFDTTPTEKYLQKTLQEHKIILDAICSGRQKTAEQAAGTHAIAIEEYLFGGTKHYILNE